MPEEYDINPFVSRERSSTVKISDVVIYDAQDVGEFSEGSVVMSNTKEFGSWDVDEFSAVEHAARFEYDRGVWIQTELLSDALLAQRHRPVPPVNQPLTALPADDE